MLISRTKEKLEAAASEIESKYKVKTKVIPADFGSTSDATWNAIKDGLAGLDVGLLINNVGLSYDHAEYYDAIDDELIDKLININVQATNKVGLDSSLTVLRQVLPPKLIYIRFTVLCCYR